jgi:hypothetical protein
MWVAIAFVLVVSNWASFWPSHTVTTWSSLPVFTALISMISLYAFTALVIPDARSDETANFSAFHEREGRRYITAHALFAAMTLPWAFAYYGFSLAALTDSVRGFTALFLSVLALVFFRVRYIQWFVAIALLINAATMMWPTIAISA